MSNSLRGYVLLLCTGLCIGCGRSDTIDEVFRTHNVKESELTLSRDEVVKRSIEAKEWSSLELETIGLGKYEGKAVTERGEVLNVEVRQTANGIYARWTNEDKPGRGFFYTEYKTTSEQTQGGEQGEERER